MAIKFKKNETADSVTLEKLTYEGQTIRNAWYKANKNAEPQLVYGRYLYTEPSLEHLISCECYARHKSETNFTRIYDDDYVYLDDDLYWTNFELEHSSTIKYSIEWTGMPYNNEDHCLSFDATTANSWGYKVSPAEQSIFRVKELSKLHAPEIEQVKYGDGRLVILVKWQGDPTIFSSGVTISVYNEDDEFIMSTSYKNKDQEVWLRNFEGNSCYCILSADEFSDSDPSNIIKLISYFRVKYDEDTNRIEDQAQALSNPKLIDIDNPDISIESDSLVAKDTNVGLLMKLDSNYYSPEEGWAEYEKKYLIYETELSADTVIRIADEEKHAKLKIKDSDIKEFSAFDMLVYTNPYPYSVNLLNFDDVAPGSSFSLTRAELAELDNKLQIADVAGYYATSDEYTVEWSNS